MSHESPLRFLQEAARLLLQYNMRTALLEQRLRQAAVSLGQEVQIVPGYRQLTIHAANGAYAHVQVHELRINIAVSARVNRIIDELCGGLLSLPEALQRLDEVERVAEKHHRGVLALIFGCAAAALAALLSADVPAMLVIGVSSALGLLARQQLAKHHVSLFALPCVAAFIGALAGGLLIRMGATTTPGICLIVPALMLVPGPHFINSLHDIVENNMTTGLARLALASAIMLSASMGIFLGGWLTLGMTTVAPWDSSVVHIPLWADMLLAGIAACGFGAVYNAPWPVLWTSIVGGMLGHGVRYLGLEYGAGLVLSTFAACVVIGAFAAGFVERLRVPFAAVAFAGAVTMMPGVLMFRAIGGAMEISLAGTHASPALVSSAFANVFTAGFVVGAMGVGLLLGARIAPLRARPAKAA
ncbi:threonine/serine exporter family protein [Uliginosibacterium sp. H3]|uniref:Threonine/serine exporter family protein n=1 Tax=Uliginosibacterium silvisoli TaxID=3114758 RepID=A0ABU6JYV2_9RHOO|nr:threonine/serine exporter family protein [Uliginosibacterium sp. H3]